MEENRRKGSEKRMTGREKSIEERERERERSRDLMNTHTHTKPPNTFLRPPSPFPQPLLTSDQ